MWHKLKKFLVEPDGGAGSDAPDEASLRLATAALLVHASLIDGDAHAAEQERMFGLLQERFELTKEQTENLIKRARAHDADAVDLYGFTRVLTEQLDPEGRAQVVEMLWEIVLSDKVLDDYEANLVWRVAELLRISTRERVVLRKKVADRLGIDV